MTIQEKFVTAYDLAEFGIKSKLKDLHGGTTVHYIVGQCRENKYTKNDVVEELHQQLLDIAKDVKDEANEMYNQIESL